MRIAQVDKVALEYEVGGNPDGEPVLLISPVLADGFLPLFGESSLTGRYRLIRYHKRGWVGSTRTEGAVTVGDHVADATALLDHLGIRVAHVVGHSSGAAVALQMAVDHPALVGSLGLLEPSLLTVPAADAFFKGAQPAFDAFAAGRRGDAVTAFMTLASGLEWQACTELMEKRMPGSVAQTITDADTLFGVELPGLMHWRFDAEVAKGIDRPALTVRGSDTRQLWVEVDERLRAWLPKVEACTIDGVGHLLQIQKPSAVAGALAEFFRRHPLGVSLDRRATS
jgi:pimeloyl-ACP methyl ester carboxylesterase